MNTCIHKYSFLLHLAIAVVTSHKYTHTSYILTRPSSLCRTVRFSLPPAAAQYYYIIIIIRTYTYPVSNGDILSSNTNRRFYCFDGSGRSRCLCTPRRFRSFAKIINAISCNVCIILWCRHYQLYVALIYYEIEILPSKRPNSGYAFRP